MANLLDTHAFLWFIFDDPRLSERALQSLQTEAPIHLSVVSLWEIAIKVNLRKLRLGMPFERFVRSFVEARQINVVGIELAHLVVFSGLPLHHRDPFDRLLIAQSKVEGFSVVTRDQRFEEYSVPVIW